MTRKEAKEYIDYYYCHTNLLDEYGDYCDQTEYEKAFDMAIKALEQENCDDCISRQAMHIELEKWITYGEYKYSNATKYLYDRIDRLPSVSPQQKMGRWIEHIEPDDAEPFVLWICENCGTIERRKTAYCTYCGAKMEV